MVNTCCVLTHYFLIIPSFLSYHFSSLLEHLICDGFVGVSEAGSSFLQRNGKPQILLSWITFFSSIYANDSSDEHSMHQILLQVRQVIIVQYKLKY
jgi:hypothetical protein